MLCFIAQHSTALHSTADSEQPFLDAEAEKRRNVEKQNF
jgi:hypothetical protein